MEANNTGSIAIFQVNGASELYGSRVRHYDYISLRIQNSRGGDTLNLDDRRDQDITPLIEIRMSMLQFAECITHIGKSAGTPCTIASYDGKTLPKYELPKQKKTFIDFADKRDSEAKARVAAVLDLVRSKLASSSKLTKTDMQEIINTLESLNDNGFFCYAREKLEEIFERSVADVKQQLEGHYSKYERITENNEDQNDNRTKTIARDP